MYIQISGGTCSAPAFWGWPRSQSKAGKEQASLCSQSSAVNQQQERCVGCGLDRPRALDSDSLSQIAALSVPSHKTLDTLLPPHFSYV